MIKLFCPVCGIPDPTVVKISGFEKKSFLRHTIGFILSCIPLIGAFILAGETATDLKKHDMAICGKCEHKWDIKSR